MTAYHAILVALSSFAAANALLLAYPMKLLRTPMRNAVKSTQIGAFALTIVACIFAHVCRRFLMMEIGTALLGFISACGAILALGLVMLVSTFRVMAINREDIQHMECIESALALSRYAGESTALMEAAERDRQILSELGLAKMLDYLLRRTSEMNGVIPTDWAEYVLQRCSETLKSLRNLDPTPFPNIGLVLSLSGIGIVAAIAQLAVSFVRF
ncbi:MAG: hypothetical protein ACM3X4_08230 [Ignavibacteriales bacterium]